jgi:L-glyceraldehyde 3-phosphate reductase
MGALDTAVRQGKALYVGISRYDSEQTAAAAAVLKKLGTPALINQPRYSMFDRGTERDRLLDRLETEGMGCISFSSLAQGVLTDRYIEGIPADSRAAVGRFLKASSITDKTIARVRALQAIARRRGQTLAQMALAWVLRDPRMTSALIGASRPEQVQDAVGALANLSFTREELAEIEPQAVDAA